jgi:chaperonin GroEL
VITVKEELTIKGEIEITKGMRFDHGYISPYFITNAKAQWIDFKKPSIFLSETKISLLQYILSSLETIAQACCQLIIIAEDVDREALSACILNKLSGQFQVIDIFSDNRKSMISDFFIFTS